MRAGRYSSRVIVAHRWPGDALPAVLVARPNRFLALCKLGRRTVEAHVPDRGRCLDLLVPGRAVALVAVDASAIPRRTRFTVVLAQSNGGTWVSLDPAGAPRLVEEALRRASRAGVRIAALRCSAGFSGMELHGEIPVLLS
jgi:sugar fermentation stimulation protein A